jgi:hypothetical protein
MESLIIIRSVEHLGGGHDSKNSVPHERLHIDDSTKGATTEVITGKGEEA